MQQFTAIRDQFVDFFRKMERAQLIRLIVLAVLIVAVAVTAVLLLGRKTYVALPISTDPTLLGKVNNRLQELEVPTRVSAAGELMVPEDQAAKLNWQLASEGYFNDDFDYSWTEMGTGFTSTESMQDAYTTIQWQENLATMIKQSTKIANAWVMLNIQEQSPFVYSGTQEESSAVVQILLADSENPLTAQEAHTIRMIVKRAHNFKDEYITIADNILNFYDPEEPLVDPELPLSDRMALRRTFEDDINRSILKLLSPAFGVRNVGVVASATLNFDKKTTQEIVFTPPVEGAEEGIPIALKELSESITGSQDPAQGEPGLDENGGAPSYVETTVGNDQVYTKVSREVNMEINETKTYIESAEGAVTALSVAVAINYDEEADVDPEAVQRLVARAAGIDEESVEIWLQPFAEQPDVLAAYNTINQQAEQYQLIRLLIIIGAIILVVVLLLIALRTILRALRPQPEPVLLAEGEGIDVVAGDALEELTAPVDTPVMQIQRFIERDAESVAQLLRNWLTDDYR